MNLYGEPLLTRKSDIASKVATSTTLFPLEVMGKYQRLKQIRVRIGLPVYRISNGRTRTYQREYIVTHPDVPSDLFTKDPESLQAQRAQHEILQKLASDEDLYKEFQTGTEQTEPIIVTNTGEVVNGNRRLCVWRTLYYQDPNKYKHFEFIELVVLPDDCDEAAVKDLEKKLQIQKTHRAEYKWHNKAAMIKEERESGATPEKLAKSYDIQKKDVELLIGALEYAELYLQKIGKQDQWSLVDGDAYAFMAMVEERKKITEQGRKELFEAVCFSLIEHKDYQDRLYKGIPEIAAHLDAIAAALQAKGVLPQTSTSAIENSNEAGDTSASDPTTNSNASANRNIQTARGEVQLSFDDDLDLLGGETTQRDSFSELATKVEDSGVRIGSLVKQVTEEQRSLKNEQKSARYLINTLSKVARDLWNIRNSGLNENSVIDGASEHIATIEQHLSEIKKWLSDHE